MKIRTRLVTTYILVACIPVFFISYIYINNSRGAIVATKLNELESIADLKVAIINSFFADLRKDVVVSQDYYNIRHNLPIFVANIDRPNGQAFHDAHTMLDAQLITWDKARGDIDDFMLLAPDGRVVYSISDFSQQEKFGQLRYDIGATAFINGKSGVFIGDIFERIGEDRDNDKRDADKQDFDFYITAPVKDEAGNFAGEIAVLVDSRDLLAIAIKDVKGLGDTGEVAVSRYAPESIADPRKHEILFSTMRFGIDPATLKEDFIGSEAGLPAQSVYDGGEVSGRAVDYRGTDVLAARRRVPVLGWDVVVKIDLAEALISARALEAAAWILGGAAALLVALVALILSLTIVKPLKELAQLAERVGTGDLQLQLPKRLTALHDATGDLARAFSVMMARLRESYAGLEQKVKDRTIELEKSLTDIEQKNKELAKSRSALANLIDDLSAEKAFAEYNVKELQKYMLAVEGASDHIIITDPEGIIIYANKSAEKITGYSRGEMLGKRPSLWGGTMPKEFYERLWETIKIKKQPFSAEVNNRHKNGAAYIAHVEIAPVLDAKGDLVFFVGIERDITKEKEIDKAKTEFVSLAAHQLRSPLSTVNWYSEMLLAGDAGKLNKTEKAYVQEVFNANQRMIELVDSLLNVSRIELGSFTVEPESIDIVEIIKSILAEFSALIKGRRLHIEQNIDKRSAHLFTDPKLLRIIFQDLISNAVKYTPPGGKIIISIATKDAEIFASVADTGYGIPKDAQSRVFTKFFRADNVREHEAIGTGLGLYIAKSIVDKLGGRIWFESVENKGTTFSFSLPMEVGAVEKSGFPLVGGKHN